LSTTDKPSTKWPDIKTENQQSCAHNKPDLCEKFSSVYK